MKKHVSLVLAIILCLAIASGCTPAPAASGTTTTGTDTTGANTTGATTTTQPTTAAAQTRLDKILANGKIVMATSPDFAPSEFIDYTKTGQEQYVGADVTLGYYIAEQLGVKLEIKAMDFSSVLAAVTTGQVDMAISGLAWKEERAESMGLSDFYNWESDDRGHGVIMAADVAAQCNAPEDFSGKTLAVQAGSLQQSLAEAQLPEDVNYQLISNLADAMMMLQTGKVDGVVSAGGTGDLLIKGIEDKYCFSGHYFEYESEGTVLAVPKGEDALLEAINGILAKAKDENLLPGWYEDAKALANSLGVE